MTERHLIQETTGVEDEPQMTIREIRDLVSKWETKVVELRTKIQTAATQHGLGELKWEGVIQEEKDVDGDARWTRFLINESYAYVRKFPEDTEWIHLHSALFHSHYTIDEINTAREKIIDHLSTMHMEVKELSEIRRDQAMQVMVPSLKSDMEMMSKEIGDQ